MPSSSAASPYSALLDASTTAVLCLSKYPYIVSSLVKSPSLAAEQFHGVNWPHYRNYFPLGEARSSIYPEWRWDCTTRLFSPTPKGVLTADLRRRSALAVRKCQALWEIVYEISVARYSAWRGPLLQETVYLSKRLQAQRYVDKGFPEDDILSYPYVHQYAAFAGISNCRAADEILFKAQLDDEFLAKSEFLRMKYFNLVKDVEKIEELNPILKKFRVETYGGSI